MSPLRAERLRELEHWNLAAEQLSDLDMLASRSSWLALEHYVGLALRQSLTSVVVRLRASIARLEARVVSATDEELAGLGGSFAALRAAFLRAETTLDFYADALATRANPRMDALLRACDHLATRAMQEALVPLGFQAPAALTYLDRGLGASILKAGIRLWDPGVENPVAAIKVVRHNLFQPTALIHEAGHQVAHLLGWNTELNRTLRSALRPHAGEEIADLWAGWSSEIAADAFAFVHTGFAALVALRHVVGGHAASVFQIVPGDPHPVSYLRVLLGVEMCRATFGSGPWDSLGRGWQQAYPLRRTPLALRQTMEQAMRVVSVVTRTVLDRPYAAFRGRSLSQVVDPRRVSPLELERLRRVAGKAVSTSPYWIWNEALRILALNGYRAGLSPSQARSAFAEQEAVMLRLGSVERAA